MQQTIDISTPDDGLGDVLRLGFDKTNQNFTELYNGKVDKVVGKGLSENDFTDADKTKLDGIETGAQVNVNADFGETDPLAPGYVLNKPPSLYASVGYFDHNDTATHTTPLVLVSGVNKKLTNDSLGAFTTLDEAPYGVSNIWNSTTNQFDFSMLAVGDTLDLRVDTLLTTTGTNKTYKVLLRLGIGTASEFYTIVGTGELKAAVTDEPVVKELSFYIGSEDIRTAPAELYFVVDTTGSIKVNGWYTRILRKNLNLIGFADAMTYKGELNLTTPILVNGVGKIGDVYKVVQPGNYDFGSGNIALLGGDFVFYDGAVYDILVFNSQLDLSKFTDATTPLVGTEKVLVHDGVDWKKVDVSEIGGGGGTSEIVLDYLSIGSTTINTTERVAGGTALGILNITEAVTKSGSLLTGPHYMLAQNIVKTDTLKSIVFRYFPDGASGNFIMRLYAFNQNDSSTSIYNCRLLFQQTLTTGSAYTTQVKTFVPADFADVDLNDGEFLAITFQQSGGAGVTLTMANLIITY